MKFSWPKLDFKFSNKNKLFLIVVAIIGLFLIFVLPLVDVIFWAKPNKEITFTIKSGDGTRKIAANLKKEKAIKSSLIFSGFVYMNHWFLQSGVYKITPKQNLFSIAKMIHQGRVQAYLVTIPEGWRVTQIDDLLAQKNIIAPGEFTKIAATDEGYLFPDTYQFPLNASPEYIRDVMKNNFNKKTTGLKITKQVITLASIVEREAKNDSDRAKIAGVYTNRLNIGMKLDADPTIQYGKGNWLPITASDYKNFQSSYNTYLHAGLPPTPICNPGLKSIQAALVPEKNDYFYFFHTKTGEAIFSKTFAEHQANLNKY